MSIEKRLQELGITLPSAAAPLANYVPYVQEGTLIFISGQVPRGDDGQLKYVGKVGQELSVEDGYASARLCALNCLAQLRAALGSLDKVKRIVRVGGFVNCTDGFTQQPQVVNGASDLIVEVFGDKGRHARAAVGNNALPGNVATEVEMVAAVGP
jgi:enamine deaminase RidA (YjgF/YER057c/UK114 family)